MHDVFEIKQKNSSVENVNGLTYIHRTKLHCHLTCCKSTHFNEINLDRLCIAIQLTLEAYSQLANNSIFKGKDVSRF